MPVSYHTAIIALLTFLDGPLELKKGHGVQ